MSNYYQNFSNFPSHDSLPSFPSRMHPDVQEHNQNIQPPVQNIAPGSIQPHAQPIFEPLPDVLSLPLDPTVQQPTQNIQELAQTNGTFDIQNHAQHFLGPSPDEVIQFETNAQQSLQNMQPQYPDLSSNPIERQHQPLSRPWPDSQTLFNSNAPESAQRSWKPRNAQQPVSIPSSANLQNCNVLTDSPLPDILTPLEPVHDQRLPPSTLLHTSAPHVMDPRQLMHNHQAGQFIRRTVSKPVIPTKKSSKTKPRGKKFVRGSSASQTKQAHFQLPPSMNSMGQLKEHEKNLKPQEPPAGLPGVMRNSAFRASLHSVLARSRKPHSTSAPNRTQSTLQPRFPDREEAHAIAVPPVRYPARDQGDPNTAQVVRENPGIPAVQMNSASGLGLQGMLPVNQSTPNLQRAFNQRSSSAPGLTIRKRPTSCSALPARRSSKDLSKKTRPCDSVDQAVAEGKELSKEQIRVLKNRQHAFNSRERTKSKRRQYDEENAALRERIARLENENEQLRKTRNVLLETAPEHLKLQVQMLENQKQENGSHGK